MAFRVGQKVVCVDDRRVDHNVISAPLVSGTIYRVRKVSGNGLCVEEILGAPYPNEFSEWAFFIYRFRPVVEKSTDTGMAILHEILDRETINDRVPARVTHKP